MIAQHLPEVERIVEVQEPFRPGPARRRSVCSATLERHQRNVRPHHRRPVKQRYLAASDLAQTRILHEIEGLLVHATRQPFQFSLFGHLLHQVSHRRWCRCTRQAFTVLTLGPYWACRIAASLSTCSVIHDAASGQSSRSARAHGRWTEMLQPFLLLRSDPSPSC